MSDAIPRAKRRFGQNFLVDQSVINHIIDCVGAQSNDHLLEIGPGPGALTGPLLASGAQLTAIEIDGEMVEVLRTRLNGVSNLRLVEADALEFDFEGICPPGKRLRVIGNLPYNISTPLLLRLLAISPRVQDMHVMVQREVALRLAAEPNCADYGRLSIAAQAWCEVELLFDVEPESFRPSPSVTSSIVRLTPHEVLPSTALMEALEKIVKQSFSHRRKMIRHTLGHLLSTEELGAFGLEPTLRAENIPVATYLRIAEFELERTPRD